MVWFGVWYEMFLCLIGGWDDDGNLVYGIFVIVVVEFLCIVGMGFDVVYLLLIYLIGKVYCKGCNNLFIVVLIDVGLLWVIGSDEGGYDIVYFSLGIIDDFDDFVFVVCDLGMEVVLDLVL